MLKECQKLGQRDWLYKWPYMARPFMTRGFWPINLEATSPQNQTTVLQQSSQNTQGLLKDQLPFILLPFPTRAQPEKAKYALRVIAEDVLPKPTASNQATPQVFSLSTVKFSHSSACLWVSTRHEWRWLAPQLWQTLNKQPPLVFIRQSSFMSAPS